MDGFNESFSLAEDDEFILRILPSELVAVVEPLVGYRRHNADLTNAHISARRAASERLLTMHVQRAEAAGNRELERLIR